MPAPPANDQLNALGSQPSVIYAKPTAAPKRRERNLEAERALAEQLAQTVGHHRQAGRAALLAGDLDTAYDELWAARQLEPDLDRLGADARAHLPADWEQETDLTPLARALSSRTHPRAADAWRRVLEDGPARSIRAEAAEFLACDATRQGSTRKALRMLHAASELRGGTSPDAFHALHAGGDLRRGTSAETLHALYRKAGLDPAAAFALYLSASNLDPRTARALNLRDPLTDALWPDQDPRWWLRDASVSSGAESDHQSEALSRARDLALTRRDMGWVLLAEGDLAAGPLGARTLGRAVRAGCAEPADEDLFVRVRLAYEGAAECLPDVAWPWYRLAELLAWAGFAQPAAEHLQEAERRSLGNHQSAKTNRAVLRALVEAAFGRAPSCYPTLARPFPPEPFRTGWSWRFKIR